MYYGPGPEDPLTYIFKIHKWINKIIIPHLLNVVTIQLSFEVKQ